jgi:hypothetical protein
MRSAYLVGWQLQRRTDLGFCDRASWPSEAAAWRRSMFAAHDPTQHLQSMKLILLLGTAGMVFFWRAMIKLLVIAIIVLIGWSVIALLMTVH